MALFVVVRSAISPFPRSVVPYSESLSQPLCSTICSRFNFFRSPLYKKYREIHVLNSIHISTRQESHSILIGNSTVGVFLAIR